jgi:hypothetical protein
MNDTQMLRAVADRQAITELIHRFCRAVDRMDAELGYSVLHDDAVADYGEAFYRGPGRGLIDHINSQHRMALSHCHRVSNVIVELDGDRAGSEAYVMATVHAMFGPQRKQVTVWGRYVDRWSRRNGRWGLDNRIFLQDFDAVHDVTPLGGADRGRRDREDASYTVLGAG